MPSALIITTYSRVNFIPYAAKDEDALLPSSTMTVKLSSLSDDFITFFTKFKSTILFSSSITKDSKFGTSSFSFSSVWGSYFFISSNNSIFSIGSTGLS